MEQAHVSITGGMGGGTTGLTLSISSTGGVGVVVGW